jgi:hypothetical protein
MDAAAGPFQVKHGRLGGRAQAGCLREDGKTARRGAGDGIEASAHFTSASR